MKIALLGKGKTGSKILELHQGEVEIFDRTHLPTYERLKTCDVVISFLPGEAFLNLAPLLLETRLPVVTGSTGFSWPKDFEKTLMEQNLTWIYGTNFSLGVVIAKQLIEKMNELSSLLGNVQTSIHEIHHTKKLDAPSGTALSMKSWMNSEPLMTHERMGDVVGVHTVSWETPAEVIKLTHEAKDRKLFAQGALWAAEYLMTQQLEHGLHAFQKVVENHLSLQRN
jgi:4-hydroxy-tetrahydrodipicolinate reductase